MKNTKLHTSRIARSIAAASAVILCIAFTASSARAEDDNGGKLLLISFDENFTNCGAILARIVSTAQPRWPARSAIRDRVTKTSP